MIEVILQYIATHWVAWLFAAISGILGAAYRRLSKQLKTEHAGIDFPHCCRKKARLD